LRVVASPERMRASTDPGEAGSAIPDTLAGATP
jgi:hypothetical protein